MDYLTIIVSAFCSIVGALSGGGIIYYRQNRRMKEVEVDAKQSDEWKRLYEKSDEDSREKDRKLDALYTERQQMYNQLIERDRTIARKDITIERLRFTRCDVNGCRRRRPPREYETYDTVDKENEKDNSTI